MFLLSTYMLATNKYLKGNQTPIPIGVLPTSAQALLAPNHISKSNNSQANKNLQMHLMSDNNVTTINNQ